MPECVMSDRICVEEAMDTRNKVICRDIQEWRERNAESFYACIEPFHNYLCDFRLSVE